MKDDPKTGPGDHLRPAELEAFRAGELPPHRQAALVQHLDGCSECQQVMQQEDIRQGPLHGIPRDGPLLPKGAGVGPGKTFGDFEQLEEIGRGGMGIVYRACLKKEPEDRPTADALASRLQRYRRRPLHRSLAAALLVAGLLVAGLLVAWIVGRPRPPRDDGTQVKGTELLPAVSRLQLKAFRVEQFQVQGKKTTLVGVISREPTAEHVKALATLPFAALVRVEVAFSEPGHAYVFGLNADGGKPQLLWPVNAEKKPDPTVVPPRVERARCPDRRGRDGGDVLLRMDDEPRGGLQAFAVVLSRQALPSFAQWQQARGPLPWRRENGWTSAWLADKEGVYPVVPERGVDRAGEEEVQAPPLLALARALRSEAKEEVVEVLAAPVEAREGQR